MNYAGLIGNKLKLLQEEEVERIHDTALEVLREVGVKVASERYLDILDEGGVKIDREEPGKIIGGNGKKIPEMAPAEVNLYGRKDEYNLNLKDRKVHYGTGGAAVNILDLGASETRSPTLEDQARLARLVEGLENVHFFQAPVVPTDVPEEDMSLNSFYASMTEPTKTFKNPLPGPKKWMT